MEIGGAGASLVTQLAQATQANRAENIRSIQVLNQNIQESTQATLQFAVEQQSAGARVKGSLIDTFA